MVKKGICSAIVALILSMVGIAHGAIRTIGTDEIRPGMKGYGLTVFEGTKPVRFEVEVVSVVPNFMLRQDIILVRCKHPVTDEAGVIGGMSGSPIYLDGRLAGALAYGWRFNTQSLAGVTPIKNMLDVLKRPQRQRMKTRKRRATASILAPPLGPGKSTVVSGQGFFDRFKATGDGQLAPVPTPLTLGGFAGAAQKLLASALNRFGMHPVMGGGADGRKGPKRFVPGGAIGVQLIRGDMSATAIGTVTAIQQNQVLAFGHPMFNMGEGALPATTARIHTVVASLARSDKLGSPARVVGAMTQDRNACIVARTDQRASMIPVKVRIHDGLSGRRDEYAVEIAEHRQLTPQFLQAALVNTISDAASDVADVTAEMKSTMKIAGRPPVTLYDSGASRTGLVALTQYFRPIGIVAHVLDNPFEEAAIESLSFDINLHYGLEIATIAGVYLTAAQPKANELVNVHIRLMRYNAPEELTSVPVRIPDVAPGTKLQIEVAGGDFISPVIPIPKNLDDLIANVQRFYAPKSLVVGINVPGQGVSIRGRVLERLPPSAVNALRPSAGVDLISPHRTALRKVYPTSFLVAGKETIRIVVGGRRNR